MAHHSRFFVEGKIDSAESFVLSDKTQVHQISRVLRLKAGSDMVLLDNSGFEYPAIIESLAENEIILKILEKRESETEPKIKLALFQCLLKKDKMEWIFEKGTELGVSKFVPILSKHCVKTDLNRERAEKIIREAAEQCGRLKLPELSEISDFEKAIAFCAKGGGRNLIFDESGGSSLKNFIYQNELSEKINPHTLPQSVGFARRKSDFPQESPQETDDYFKGAGVNIFIGSEGGFSRDEIAFAEKSGFQTISLGKRILRAETAAVAACALLID